MGNSPGNNGNTPVRLLSPCASVTPASGGPSHRGCRPPLATSQSHGLPLSRAVIAWLFQAATDLPPSMRASLIRAPLRSAFRPPA